MLIYIKRDKRDEPMAHFACLVGERFCSSERASIFERLLNASEKG